MRSVVRGLGFLVIMAIAVIAVSACGPMQVEKLVNIEANETVFVVPLEAKVDDQGKFMSIDYLEKSKVATKRVSLKQRQRDLGRMWYDYEWIPTERVIKVDRSPVTRDWTVNLKTGTGNGKDEAIWVQSLDSIDFGVGISITGSVSEKDTAKFLYHYAGKPLHDVMDTNVRSFLISILSREFGALPLGNVQKLVEMASVKGHDLTKEGIQTCFTQRAAIIEKAFKEAKEYFNEFGVTINTLGGSEGFEFKDQKIRDSINATFTSAMKIQEENNKNESQAKINSRNVAIAEAERDSAKKFAEAAESRIKQVTLDIQKMNAEAQLEWAKKWDGKLPANMIPDKSNLMMDFSNAKR